MTNTHIGRRNFLSLLPSLGFIKLQSNASPNRNEGPSLVIDAVDSLYRYRQLLEKARGDAYQAAATNTLLALKDCSQLLADLMSAVVALREHLHNNTIWPTLQRRFAAIENSLTLMQGRHTDEVNSDALRSLPATTASLHSLMKDVSSDCNDDPDGHITTLIDHVYDALEAQNQGLKRVEGTRALWNQRIEAITKAYSGCASNIDSASVAIANAETNEAAWRQDTTRYLRAAQGNLELLLPTSVSLPGATGSVNTDEYPAGLTLYNMLTAVLESMGVTRVPTPVAFYGYHGIGESSGAPSSISLTKTDPTLVNNVLVIVKNPRYFSPMGSTTQVIDCIAVCWPLWIVYPSDAPNDIRERKSLIRSALYFRLIWGTVTEEHEALADELQSVYWKTLQATI